MSFQNTESVILDIESPSSRAPAYTIQTQSPFLRLPAEVRNRIYNHLYTPAAAIARNKPTYHRPSPFITSPPNLPALSQTCHQLCFETRLLPFLSSEFTGSPSKLIAALRALAPEHRALVTHVTFLVSYDDTRFSPTRPPVGLLGYEFAEALQALVEFEGVEMVSVERVMGYWSRGVELEDLVYEELEYMGMDYVDVVVMPEQGGRKR
ncbi:hypothetical protein IAQ61_004462 [Plenodomus lingam]|uniref:Predicted protein n=1 Tax=Leptosphaeria maculans (strain JN3 / isolate v23.1.3 / race Av1-4-5-6-7-8) TaxID=985895 RepID=E4ZVL0_LEPMJ|nr:predicted protein [Plenodomus lingam JN3]KAH9873835.1 hypothetical protein IAQ61_004462 [Plenodomus lingam]CBX95636.1 predicted protein [Plenodomus lingam JN3]